MTKKNKNREHPLNADPKRQAHAQLKGYLYQIWHSVDAWLDLADDEILYLECAEDFDIVSGEDATVTQVKHTKRNITLKSQEVCDAINNFGELQTNNPGRRVKYRFLTRSKIGMEQGNPFGKDKPGLELWQRCSGDEAAIIKISEFLQSEDKISDEVKDFLKHADPDEIYKQLIEPITWDTDSKPSSFVEESIRKKLVYHGDRHGISPSKAKDIVESLINEAWRVAGQPENRELTRLRFLEIFEEKTKRLVSEQYLQHVEMLTAKISTVGTGFTGGSSDITVRSHLHIQTNIPPSYLDVIVPRKNLLTNILTKLQSEGIVIIQGGVDTGKTTLAKLAANDISGSWFWLNFTNGDPSSKDFSSQVAQLLQQLAIAVSNKSEQVNVVLDDLNLLPQQWQTYEEDLGIVVYRVLERGAKLLLTSQFNPPNNFIRSLGLSPSIVTHVPNFTIPEIEQFAVEMGCTTEDVKTWSGWVQIHTKGHPRLVHARLTQLQQENWKYQGKIESILQTPQDVVKEREEARQLLLGLSEVQRKFLYRLSLLTEFRKDHVLNIGEIPEPIPDPGDIFSQLVGPWIDQINENYYTISPLLTDAAKQVWSKKVTNKLHAQIADAILETDNLTTIEARTVLTHSMLGNNKEGLITVIHALMTAPKEKWEMLSREFSWLRRIKIAPHEELFPGETFVNYCFRSLQYRIAVEIEPEFAPKILEIWDEETKPYEPHEAYLLSRLMLVTQALIYYQVLLPAKQMVTYLKEIIDITNNLEEVQEIHNDSAEEIKKYKTEKSNYFSILFGFIYARCPMYAPFLSELIDAVEELQPEIRTLLLADFEDDTIDSRILINGIWLAEADRENPDWTRCLQVFDKVIERAIAWDYPHLAAAAARGKATIHDEYLNEPDTAHEVIQDFVLKARPSPIIEEQQAVIYLHQKRYKEALSIYEGILPKWDPPAGQLDVMPSVACRRAAICAAQLDDWKKAATFFEDAADRTQKTVNPERNVGFYADAGFAHFKAGNMLNCIKFLHLALENFEKLPPNKTDVKYFTLKKRIEHTINWIRIIWYEGEDNSSLPFEPPVGFCSDPETKEEFLDLPDCPIGYSWLFLAQIEYRFGHETTVFQHALQTTDRDTYPDLSFFLSLLKTQYDFRNKTFNELPARIQQLANACNSIQKHLQSGKGIREEGIGFIPVEKVPNFASVENITVMLVAALVIQLSAGADTHAILSIWRANSSELFIKENMTNVLNLIDRMLTADQNNALKVMKTQDIKPEERLTAALKVVHNNETSPENLFHAHTLITTYLINNLIWMDPFMVGLSKLLSIQWLEKIQFRTALKMPMVTVPEIEQACKSSETGKKKIGQILLAVHPAVSARVAPEILQQFRAWTEPDQKQGPATRKNPAAQRLIKAMEKPPHLTDEDIEVLNQSIKEGEIPIKFDSPFDSDESENNE